MTKQRTDAEVLAAMKERLTYHPELGEFRRRVGFQGVVEGSKLGCPDTHGKLQATFLKKRYMVSHLVWLWETGTLPGCTLSHVNGQPADCRFENLSNTRVIDEQDRVSREQRFLAEAHAKFGTAHDYSDTQYASAKSKVTIRCPLHGMFTRLPSEYLKSAKGCPKCCREHANEQSRATPAQKAAKATRERDRQRVWRNAHRDEYNAKFRRHYHRNKGDPKMRATKACRTLLTRVIRQTKGRRRKPTEDILGYSFDEFRLHIETQFEDWMTWANHGDWHVDHITPVSWYVVRGITDPAIINRLDNLRPLDADANRHKHNKLL